MSPSRRLRLATQVAALPLLSAALLTSSAAGATTSVQGEAMSLPSSQGRTGTDSSAVGGKALIIWSNGTATGSISGAADTVSVRARGDQCGGAPQMTVTVDGRQVLSVAVPATMWTDYAAPAAFATGTHQLAIAFTNDYLSSSCDRNLYVDQVTLSQVAPPPPAAGGVEAETMSLPAASGQVTTDTTASGGRSMLIWSNDSATTTVTLPTATTVTVRARGDQCGGAPQLAVTVDGRPVLSAAVPATTWSDYTAPAAVSAGSHAVAVSFTNDYLDSSCDRNLYVDRLTFSSTAPTPTSAPTAAAFLMDYQTADFSQWEPEQQLFRAAQQAIVTTPARAGYPYTARFIVAPGDYTNGGITEERSDVYLSVANTGTPTPGQTMWFGWSVYIPAGFQVDSDAESPVGNGWITFTDLHGSGPTGNGNVSFGLTKGTATPHLIVQTEGGTGRSTLQEWIMPSAFPLGQWVDMRLGVVFGESTAVGRITVKQDGVTLINNAACANLFTGESAYFKQGLYRAASNRTHTIYYTGTRRGLTEASVML